MTARNNTVGEMPAFAASELSFSAPWHVKAYKLQRHPVCIMLFRLCAWLMSCCSAEHSRSDLYRVYCQHSRGPSNQLAFSFRAWLRPAWLSSCVQHRLCPQLRGAAACHLLEAQAAQGHWGGDMAWLVRAC